MEEAFEVRKVGRVEEVTDNIRVEVGKKVKLVVERVAGWGQVECLDNPRDMEFIFGSTQLIKGFELGLA